MFKEIIAAIVINILLLASPPTTKAPTVRYHGYELNREAIRRAKLATVLISVEGFEGAWRGTGIIIDRTHVLTCFHVANTQYSDQELWVYYYPGYVSARGKLVWADSYHDLAILEVDVPTTGCPRVRFQDRTYDGEPITIIGNAEGAMKWYVGYGIVSGRGGHYLYTDGTLVGGDSGGPWVNERGEVVAISDWGLATAKGQDLPIRGGVDGRAILGFLKEWDDVKRTPAKDAKAGVVKTAEGNDKRAVAIKWVSRRGR